MTPTDGPEGLTVADWAARKVDTPPRPWPVRAGTTEPAPAIVCDDCEGRFPNIATYRAHDCVAPFGGYSSPEPEPEPEATEAEVEDWARYFPEVPAWGDTFTVQAFLDSNGARVGQIVVQMEVWCALHQKAIGRYGSPWVMTWPEVQRSIREHLETFHALPSTEPAEG